MAITRTRLVSFLLPAALLACMAGYAQAETLTIPVGRAELINVSSDMTEVIVANPEVADAHVHDKRTVSILAKKIGSTSVSILGHEGQLRNISVSVGYDLPAIRKALKEFMPYEQVGVEMLNTNIVLTGRVSSVLAAERAVKIVTEYLEPAYGGTGVVTTSTTTGAGSGSGAANFTPPKVMNLLEVTSGQQVMLRVRVGEIKRTALKNIGVNLQAIKSSSNSALSIGTGTGLELFNLSNDAAGLGRFGNGNTDRQGILGGVFTNSSGDGVAAILEALERNNLFKILAEPNLVSLSGEPSQFLAGGEFPVPVPQLQGVAIEYKPFGVSVKFTPFVLEENRIRIAVEPEVSEINDDGALLVEGFAIPGLTTRRAQTVVELSAGESFMIAGLIQDKVASRIDSLPGLKEIPILGALFSSVSYQREETELVLAVTPYIVDPVISADIKLPTDDFRPASMMEMFFYGAMGSLHGDVDRMSQTPTIEGPIGFMVD